MNSQVELIRILSILRVAGLTLLAGCAGNAGSSSPPPPPPPSPPLSVTGMDVSPSSVALEPGGAQQFTATVSPSGVNQTVTWSLSGTGCTGESCGAIDTTGKYTAPAAGAPVPFFAWVTAVAAANTDWSRSAAVTVSVPTSDNVKLSGRYAVLIRGSVPDEAPQVALVGSFVADGNGNLYAGEGYLSAGISTTGPQRLALANGSYSVGSDSHGTMTLDFVRSDNSHFSINVWFALDSLSPAGVAAHGSLIVPVLGSGTGFLVKQDPGAFSTATINGDYAFGLMGLGDSFDQENVALGRFTASGGSLSAGHIDLVGCGISDQLQSDRPFTGTYSVDASGRGGGVATLDISGSSNPLNVVFYVVSSSEMLWMEGRGGTAGTALQQSGRPFSASSLNGTAVFGTANTTAINIAVSVGEVWFDGRGGLTGMSDGDQFADEPISGTYTVDSNGFGRGVISEVKGPGLNLFYLVSPNRGFIISGNGSFEFGTFEPQTGGPFSDTSFRGNYVFATVPFSPLDLPHTTGIVSADGVRSFTGLLTGNYSVAQNGRATLSPNMVFYFVSPSKAIGLGPSGNLNAIER